MQQYTKYTTMYNHLQLCKMMQLCTFMDKYVQLCTVIYTDVQWCTVVYNYVNDIHGVTVSPCHHVTVS